MFLLGIMKKIMSKISKIVSFILGILFIVVPLSSCASIDSNGQSTASLSNERFIYDSSLDQTRFDFYMGISNGTIYNSDKQEFTFEFYYDGVSLGMDTLYYSLNIDASSTKTYSCYAYLDGHIDEVEFVRWDCNYLSFWDTYFGYLIGIIVCVVVLATIYIITMIVQDIDLNEVGEFITDHFYFVFMVIVPLIPYFIVSGVSNAWNWMPPVLIIGGIVLLVGICLLAHLIKYFVENRDFKFATASCLKDTETGKEYFIEDLLDDEESLNMFSKNELIEYCKENGIKGYSNLNKAELVALVMGKKIEFNKNKAIIKNDSNTITFDDIAGLKNAKESFNEKVILPIKHRELYRKYNKKVGGGILLYGLPGTGKTMFAEAASNALDALFIPIKCSDIKSKWYGESEQKVKEIFTKARKAKRAIIFFDEFESIGSKRKDDGEDSGGNGSLVTQILVEMQGIGSFSNGNILLVIAATNKPWLIDSAFLRPGRFDELIYIPLPDEEARRKMFELKFAEMPMADNIDYDCIVNISEGFNGADITEFVERVKQIAINKSIESKQEHIIDMNDICEVGKNMHSSIVDDEIDKILEFKERNN